jgi:hypothetical protein
MGVHWLGQLRAVTTDRRSRALLLVLSFSTVLAYLAYLYTCAFVHVLVCTCPCIVPRVLCTCAVYCVLGTLYCVLCTVYSAVYYSSGISFVIYGVLYSARPFAL